MTVQDHQPIGAWLSHGVALCREAQADGVPCPELGKDCETCANAIRHMSPADLEIIRARLLKKRGIRRP
jgi:hypothetical protein